MSTLKVSLFPLQGTPAGAPCAFCCKPSTLSFHLNPEEEKDPLYQEGRDPCFRTLKFISASLNVDPSGLFRKGEKVTLPLCDFCDDLFRKVQEACVELKALLTNIGELVSKNSNAKDKPAVLQYGTQSLSIMLSKWRDNVKKTFDKGGTEKVRLGKDFDAYNDLILSNGSKGNKNGDEDEEMDDDIKIITVCSLAKLQGSEEEDEPSHSTRAMRNRRGQRSSTSADLNQDKLADKLGSLYSKPKVKEEKKDEPAAAVEKTNGNNSDDSSEKRKSGEEPAKPPETNKVKEDDKPKPTLVPHMTPSGNVVWIPLASTSFKGEEDKEWPGLKPPPPRGEGAEEAVRPSTSTTMGCMTTSTRIEVKREPGLKTPITCEICHTQFMHTSTYEYHKELHTLGPILPQYYCRFCSKRPSTSHIMLRTHEQERHEDKLVFSCKQENCEQSFGRDYLLQIHSQTHRVNPPYTCSLCEVDYPTGAKLMSHLVLCHIAKNGFNNPPELEEPEEKCEFCSKVFKTSFMLLKHLYSTHEEEGKTEKMYICDTCSTEEKETRFRSKTLFTRHVQLHERLDGRPAFKFVCANCGWRLKSEGELKRHQDKACPNSENNPVQGKFICKVSETCKESFGSKPALIRHQNSRHVELLKFTCPTCQKKYCDLKFLQTHKQLHEEDVKEWKCRVCIRHKAFSKKEDLEEHLAIHNGETMQKCPHCEDSFDKRNLLSRHLTAKHKALKDCKFKCYFCPQFFKTFAQLSTHFGIHTKEKDLKKCGNCHKEFSGKVYKTHVKTCNERPPVLQAEIVNDGSAGDSWVRRSTRRSTSSFAAKRLKGEKEGVIYY